MGGVIIRAGLPHLAKYRPIFCSFLSFASPHIGMTYNSSFLVSMGMNFFVTFKKYASIKELLLKDQSCFQDNFLFKLSKDDVSSRSINPSLSDASKMWFWSRAIRTATAQSTADSAICPTTSNSIRLRRWM